MLGLGVGGKDLYAKGISASLPYAPDDILPQARAHMATEYDPPPVGR